MFVNSKVNGLFLLLIFGSACGLLAGALFGSALGLYVQTFPRADYNGQALILAAGIGAAFGLVPGVLYGLSSYYFGVPSDWLFTGGVYGAIPGFILIMPLGWHGWPLILFCASYGVLVGLVNLRFPNWWGMRLRAEGIELLRRKS